MTKGSFELWGSLARGGVILRAISCIDFVCCATGIREKTEFYHVLSSVLIDTQTQHTGWSNAACRHQKFIAIACVYCSGY